MAKISVIVPVYNAEKYLNQCIQSIQNQSYTDFELILVNDGSTDASGDICESYVKTDQRIKLFTKINGGVSSARNLGLDNATGEWVTFIDSDDWVDKDYLQKMIEGNFNFDFIVSYYYAEGWKEWISDPFDDCQYNTEDIKVCLNKNLRRFSFICCKLYRRGIIEDNKIRFDTQISYAEDSIFTYTYMRYIKNVRTLSDALYCYNCHSNNSLTSQKISWTTASYTINQMCDAIGGVEKQFDWDGRRVKYYYTWAYLRKYINSSASDDTIAQTRSNLKCVNENFHVLEMFNSDLVLKSKFRRLFDYLMRNRLFLAVSIMIHCEYYLLRRGIIKR